MKIRDALITDFPRILQLNEESVHFLSLLDHDRLEMLHAQAAYHRVAVHGGEISAFLLAFREGRPYDSINYRWFAAGYDRFLYVDRVVVSSAHRGCGIGGHLYDDLFRFARTESTLRVTCEFDVDPPNESSRRFHARYGFEEVGTQQAGGKQVSLQAALL